MLQSTQVTKMNRMKSVHFIRMYKKLSAKQTIKQTNIQTTTVKWSNSASALRTFNVGFQTKNYQSYSRTSNIAFL